MRSIESMKYIDLIDAACATYFVSKERQNFGAQVRLRD